jgi:hypothetical protein
MRLSYNVNQVGYGQEAPVPQMRGAGAFFLRFFGDWCRFLVFGSSSNGHHHLILNLSTNFGKMREHWDLKRSDVWT